MHNPEIMRQMKIIFNTYYYDWFGVRITKNNPLTYHHIIEECNGGLETIDNGALVTRKIHELLNRAQIYDPKLYGDCNYWLKTINDMKGIPTEEIKSIMVELRNQLNGVMTKRTRKVL